MAFTAKLFIEGEERNVLNSVFLYQQLMDSTGRPKTQVHKGMLQLQLESTKNDELFYQWMFANQQVNKGYVRFYKRDGFSKLFDFEFANCHCVYLEENFASVGDDPMIMTLHLSPGIQKVRDQVFEKPWNPSNPFANQAPITEREEKQDPEILESFFENRQGEKITKIRKGQDTYLVLKTNNMVGKQVDIDLGINEGAFEHEGQLLEEYTLKELTITSNVMKIELKSVAKNN